MKLPLMAFLALVPMTLSAVNIPKWVTVNDALGRFDRTVNAAAKMQETLNRPEQVPAFLELEAELEAVIGEFHSYLPACGPALRVEIERRLADTKAQRVLFREVSALLKRSGGWQEYRNSPEEYTPRIYDRVSYTMIREKPRPRRRFRVSPGTDREARIICEAASYGRDSEPGSSDWPRHIEIDPECFRCLATAHLMAEGMPFDRDRRGPATLANLGACLAVADLRSGHPARIARALRLLPLKCAVSLAGLDQNVVSRSFEIEEGRLIEITTLQAPPDISAELAREREARNEAYARETPGRWSDYTTYERALLRARLADEVLALGGAALCVLPEVLNLGIVAVRVEADGKTTCLHVPSASAIRTNESGLMIGQTNLPWLTVKGFVPSPAAPSRRKSRR